MRQPGTHSVCAAPTLGSLTELQLRAFGLMLTLTTANFFFFFSFAMLCASSDELHIFLLQVNIGCRGTLS